MASNLLATASTLQAMASNLLAMAPNLKAMSCNNGTTICQRFGHPSWGSACRRHEPRTIPARSSKKPLRRLEMWKLGGQSDAVRSSHHSWNERVLKGIANLDFVRCSFRVQDRTYQQRRPQKHELNLFFFRSMLLQRQHHSCVYATSPSSSSSSPSLK